jgi:hypothetical protein
MTRLKKVAEELSQQALGEEKEADIEAAKMSITQIRDSINEVHEAYLRLFNNLNSIYQEYPKLYDTLKKVVRFPNEHDAEDIAEMKVDYDDIMDHFDDEQYLATTLNLYNTNNQG